MHKLMYRGFNVLYFSTWFLLLFRGTKELSMDHIYIITAPLCINSVK